MLVLKIEDLISSNNEIIQCTTYCKVDENNKMHYYKEYTNSTISYLEEIIEAKEIEKLKILLYQFFIF